LIQVGGSVEVEDLAEQGFPLAPMRSVTMPVVVAAIAFEAGR
jgi:hypothetical protein